MSEQTVSSQPERRYATRVLSVRNRVPDEPGRQTNRWTETPLYNATDIARALVSILPRQMLIDVELLVADHLSLDTPAGEAPR